MNDFCPQVIPSPRSWLPNEQRCHRCAACTNHNPNWEGVRNWLPVLIGSTTHDNTAAQFHFEDGFERAWAETEKGSIALHCFRETASSTPDERAATDAVRKHGGYLRVRDAVCLVAGMDRGGRILADNPAWILYEDAVHAREDSWPVREVEVEGHSWVHLQDFIDWAMGRGEPVADVAMRVAQRGSWCRPSNDRVGRNTEPLPSPHAESEKPPRGRPMSETSLRHLNDTGQLQADAIAAAKRVRERTPHNVNRATVVRELLKTTYGPQSGFRFSDSTLKNWIREEWWQKNLK